MYQHVLSWAPSHCHSCLGRGRCRLSVLRLRWWLGPDAGRTLSTVPGPKLRFQAWLGMGFGLASGGEERDAVSRGHTLMGTDGHRARSGGILLIAAGRRSGCAERPLASPHSPAEFCSDSSLRSAIAVGRRPASTPLMERAGCFVPLVEHELAIRVRGQATNSGIMQGQKLFATVVESIFLADSPSEIDEASSGGPASQQRIARSASFEEQ